VLFNAIPLNDAAWARFWQPHWLNRFFQWVYSNGFTLSYWVCIIRAFFIKTLYQKIHWALDAVAGMLFAYGCVKLADFIVGSRFYEAFVRKFEGLGYAPQERMTVNMTGRSHKLDR
jgi:hypothetical protein